MNNFAHDTVVHKRSGLVLLNRLACTMRFVAIDVKIAVLERCRLLFPGKHISMPFLIGRLSLCFALSPGCERLSNVLLRQTPPIRRDSLFFCSILIFSILSKAFFQEEWREEAAFRGNPMADSSYSGEIARTCCVRSNFLKRPANQCSRVNMNTDCPK